MALSSISTRCICSRGLEFSTKKLPFFICSSGKNMTYATQSKAFPSLKTFDLYIRSDVVTKPKWDSPDLRNEWIELLFSPLLTESLPQLYSNLPFSTMVTCRAPAFSFIATKDGCIRRSSARTSGGIRKNPSRDLEGSGHVSSSTKWKNMNGKHGKTMENIYCAQKKSTPKKPSQVH